MQSDDSSNQDIPSDNQGGIPDENIQTPETTETPLSSNIQQSQAYTPTANDASKTVSDNNSWRSRIFADKKRNLFLVIVIVAVVILGTGAAAYNLLIVPNNPEKLWPTALSNTGKVYDRFINYAEQNKDIKGINITGTFKGGSGNFTTDGSINGKFYEGNGEIKTDIGLGTSRPVIESRFIKSSSGTPDIYIKINGVKGAGSQFGESGAGIEAMASSLDGQWIGIDHTLLDNLTKAYASQAGVDAGTGTADLTSDDIVDISKKTGEALDNHVFTDDKAKAVFVIKESVGKEKRDDRQNYHYKVTVNKQNLKDFVTDLKNRINQTKLKQTLGSRSLEEAMGYDNLLKQIDQMNTDKAVADVWVDMGTKLIRYIRINDEKSADNYVELGIPYDGGDEYPFTINAVNKSGEKSENSNFKFTINTKTSTATAITDFSSGDVDFKLDLKMTENKQPIQVEKPANPKPLSEVLGALFGGANLTGLSSANPMTANSPSSSRASQGQGYGTGN